MRGFVPTPDAIVDEMVGRLFSGSNVRPSSRVLDPGCGEGAFISGVVRWCERHNVSLPQIVGIESHPGRATIAKERFAQCANVSIVCRDFLVPSEDPYDYVIGNPPYVSILDIPEPERDSLRAEYTSARGRFDLYMLFFEQALRVLRANGRLVFVTPEKFLYVNAAEALRGLLSQHRVVDLTLLREDIFKGLVTYPTITTVEKSAPRGTTNVRRRDGGNSCFVFPGGGGSLLPLIEGSQSAVSTATLGDLCVRISCGVATGADGVFVLPNDRFPSSLAPYAYPTIAGKQLVPGSDVAPSDMMLIPYDKNGRLISAARAKELASYLDPHRDALLKRTCAARKPWYAFHDSVPFDEMLRPKILCKDITKVPHFWLDRSGEIVPRHSVYYIVPRDPGLLEGIVEYLRSDSAQKWLRANCQRAANGFLRVQSSVLRRLPIPEALVDDATRAAAMGPLLAAERAAA